MTAYRLGAKLGRPFASLLTRTGPQRTAMFWLIHARASVLDPAEAAETVRAYADAPGFSGTRSWCVARQIEGLDEITCPVVIAWGSKGRLLVPRQGPRFTQRIAGSRLVGLPGLGPCRRARTLISWRASSLKPPVPYAQSTGRPRALEHDLAHQRGQAPDGPRAGMAVLSRDRRALPRLDPRAPALALAVGRAACGREHLARR